MLKDITEYFLSQIFIPLERIVNIPDVNYEINAIKFKNLIQYGKIGSGKTELIRGITERAVDYYGVDNVNAVKANSGQLLSLIYYGLNNKLIQLLFTDDISIRKIDRFHLAKYFNIRHLWKDYIKRNYGYILGIVATHRFHNIPTILRTNFDGLICKNAPNNPWDRVIMKGFIGEEAIDYLYSLERDREEDRNLMSYSICKVYNKVGILNIPMATTNYLQELIGNDLSYLFK